MATQDRDNLSFEPLEAGSGVVDAHASPRKHFTLSEANRALSYVSRIIEDLVACYMRLKALRAELDQKPTAEDRPALEAEYERLMSRLSAYVDEIHSAGAELKDFERGLIDFPAMHQGREILLCWQRGEPRIVAWHDVDAGFAGRRDVAELETADA